MGNLSPEEQAIMARDILDIRPPDYLPDYWMWFYIALLVIGVAGLIFMLVRWILKKRKEPPLTPYQLLMQRLGEAELMISPRQAQGFSINVSGALRTYIETSLELPATSETTEEFIRRLAGDSSGPLAIKQKDLKGILEFSDLAKFARWQLTEGQMRTMLDSTRDVAECCREAAEARKKEAAA